MTPEEYNRIPATKRPDVWVTLNAEQRQAIIDADLPAFETPPKAKPMRPLEGLDTYHPYVAPSSVNLLHGLGWFTIIVGVALYFTFGVLVYALTALGAAGSLFLWAIALNYLARTAHYTRVSAAMLWAQRRADEAS